MWELLRVRAMMARGATVDRERTPVCPDSGGGWLNRGDVMVDCARGIVVDQKTHLRGGARMCVDSACCLESNSWPLRLCPWQAEAAGILGTAEESDTRHTAANTMVQRKMCDGMGGMRCGPSRSLPSPWPRLVSQRHARTACTGTQDRQTGQTGVLSRGSVAEHGCCACEAVLVAVQLCYNR